MIFLTVGTQLPFDRLVRAVDLWAAADDRRDVVAQIADPGPAGYRPNALRWTAFLAPDDVRANMEKAEFIVAHAGMGTIISAMTLGKPIVILPRRRVLGEHRNDHQVATAKRMMRVDGVVVAQEAHDLPPRLDAMAAPDAETSTPRMSFDASERFAARLREEIVGVRRPAARARGA